MRSLTSELHRIAVELADSGDGVSEEAAPVEVQTVEEVEEQEILSLDGFQKRHLDAVAKSEATNLGDGTSVAEKAVEYMRSGHGDEYYDYGSIVSFFRIVGDARSLDALASVGLRDVAARFESEASSVSGGNLDLMFEAEAYLCEAFGRECGRYFKTSVDLSRRAAWAGYGAVVENLAESFFDSEFDCASFIAKYFDYGRDRILAIARQMVSERWRSYYAETESIPGGILGFLYDCGDGSIAYSRSLQACQEQFRKSFSEAWVSLDGKSE